MAKVVGAFLLPHNPGITAVPKERCDPQKHANVFAHFARIAERLQDLRADTVIVVGDDHYTNFGPHCIPRCLIAIGDVEGPQEDWLNFEHRRIQNNEPLAQHILKIGWGDGIDWAFAKALNVDHAVAIPYELSIRPVEGVRVIPVYLNTGVEPVISSRRALEIGQSIRHAVDTWSGDERVVVFGTGGMSHWVGNDGMGRVNEEFDHEVIELIESGDVDALIALPDERIDEEGGNGALEIKNFFCAMGVFPEGRGKTIGYEAMPELITGLAFVELVP